MFFFIYLKIIIFATKGNIFVVVETKVIKGDFMSQHIHTDKHHKYTSISTRQRCSECVAKNDNKIMHLFGVLFFWALLLVKFRWNVCHSIWAIAFNSVNDSNLRYFRLHYIFKHKINGMDASQKVCGRY